MNDGRPERRREDEHPGELRFDDLSPEEVRVLGCLIEKEATVPDSYPLTLNSLRTACNQSTSRDPVVSYADHEVERALMSLRARGLTRTVHSTSNRAAKYRHVVPGVLGLEPGETALLSVLMLRGPQTVGELKTRCERQHSFESTDQVAALLAGLAARDAALVLQLDRQSGQKDARWIQLLSPSEVAPEPAASPAVAIRDHLDTVFEHHRLRIELGPHPGDDDSVEVRVIVAAEPFGGELAFVLTSADVDRLLGDLDAEPAGRIRLGGDGAALLELRIEPEDGQGPNLSVECSILRTEADQQEWLQFVMVGVPPFAADTAVRTRRALARSVVRPAGGVPGERHG
ncbi:MAG: YceH family protein [Ilumatobacteraceae bacterium]